MTDPQHDYRAFLEDGPYRGETVSVSPDEDDSVPKTIMVNPATDGRRPRESHDHQPLDVIRPQGPVTYRYSHPDMDHGLWVYRQE